MTLIRKEKILTRGTQNVVIQIRYHSWEDDYGCSCWNNEVYYKHIDNDSGRVIREDVVTPQHITHLSDIFDCPLYFDRIMTFFKDVGFYEKSTREQLLNVCATTS